MKGQVGEMQKIAAPIIPVIQASGAVDAIQKGMSGFMEGFPSLMKALDEVAKIHPFVAGTRCIHSFVS